MSAPLGGSRRLGPWLALGVAVLGSAVVYAPIIHIFFHEDDFFLLFQFANDPLLLSLVRPYLGHANLVRNVVFGATYAAFGPVSEAFQATVLVGHLLTVALLFAVIHRVTRSALVACFGALLWGTCPASIGTLGWYAAFGHTLCTLLTLLAFGVVLRAYDAPDGLTPRRIVACILLLAAGATSFGAGLGMALAFPAIVWIFARPRVGTRPALVATVAIPAAAAALYLGQRLVFHALGGTENEQLVMLGIQLIDPRYAAALLVRYFGFGIASLASGPFLDTPPWPTLGMDVLVGVVGMLTLLAAWLGTPRERRVLLAVLVLAAAAYGSVVAGRAGLMKIAAVTPAKAAMALRYHYAAQAWLALGLSTALAILLARMPRRAAHALASAAVAVVLASHILRTHPYDFKPRVRLAVAETLDRVRAAAAAAPPGETVRIANERFRGAPILARRPAVFPGTSGVFLVFHPGSEVDGRPIVFEGTRAHVALARARGGRIASLLVAPPDGQPDPPY